MDLKLLKSQADYEAAMSWVSGLMNKPSAKKNQELEVWATLIEKYESERLNIDMPSPIEAIKMRMDQMGLAQSDMVDYFGSKERVSEVLNGKRNISITMMKKLVNGLNIPAKVFLQTENKELQKDGLNPSDFPLKDMLKKGYFNEFFSGTLVELKKKAEQNLVNFFEQLPGAYGLQKAMMRTSAHNDDRRKVNDYALWAWQVKVLLKCKNEEVAKFDQELINDNFLRRVSRLSFLDDGPILVKEFLAKNGIHLVFEPHLEQTYLDGAAFWNSGNPVVALTLRFDRLDNFWFTILHELAHISLKHINKKSPLIFDSNLSADDTDEIEKEANEKASEGLGIKSFSELKKINDYSDVVRLAKTYELSPSIIIGQARRVQNNHSLFTRKMEKVVRDDFY